MENDVCRARVCIKGKIVLSPKQMKGRDTMRNKGALVYTLDQQEVAFNIAHALWRKYRDQTNQNLQFYIDGVKPLESGLVYGDGKAWALVNTEGVGSYAEDYNHTVEAWYSFYGGEYQATELEFTDVDSAVTGQTEDLSEFIRTFGDRLENNFDSWYSFSDKEDHSGPQKLINYEAVGALNYGELKQVADILKDI